MQIKVYVIDLGLPRWTEKVLALVGIPALVVASATALVRADPVEVPNQFASGDTLSSAKLNANFAALRDAINDDDPACPRGYAQQGSAASFLPSSIVCAKGDDEVVKVGTGASGFWIDRYEASAWTAAQGGTQIADSDPDAYAAAGLPMTGQVTDRVYARSVRGVKPSRSMTWFQAVEMCAASGKRLPMGSEWLRAARGTWDPDAYDGATGPRCNTNSTAPSATPRLTGLGVGTATGKDGACVSDWGAEDMVGNVWERLDDWLAAPSMTSTPPGALTPWPATGVTGSYEGDGTWGISSYAYSSATDYKQGMPSGVARGGSWYDGVLGGVFAVAADTSPSNWPSRVGFRCVLPR